MDVQSLAGRGKGVPLNRVVQGMRKKERNPAHFDPDSNTHLFLREHLDPGTDDVDASLVRGVQLQHRRSCGNGPWEDKRKEEGSREDLARARVG
jgi:hypothetical protein